VSKLKDYGRLLVAIFTLIGVILLIWAISELIGLRSKWQTELELARVRRLEAATERIEERRQYVMLLPGIVAQLSDTFIAGAATLIGWLMAIGMIGERIVERMNG